jgi:hypothetical protein
MRNKKKQSEMERIIDSIRQIKDDIFRIDDMRPGSLSQQMRKAKEKYGSYWQLSYTYRGKGKTEYVRNAFVKQVRVETQNFKRYRKLSDQLVQLSIDLSRLKMKVPKKEESE